MTKQYYLSMLCEWCDWHQLYLPIFSLQGRTVLDIGAGCGETAYFFLRNGADKVICVEKEEKPLRLLRRNVEMNGWNAEVHGEPFSLSMLNDYKFDFMKMDIEGGERALLTLPYNRLPPCAIEAHCSCIAGVHRECTSDALVKKFELTRQTGTVSNNILVNWSHSSPGSNNESP